VVRYVQLAHNVRHPESGHAVAQVLHSFGREDQLDRDGLTRLVGSLSRYLDLEQPAASRADNDDGGGLKFVSSKTLGGTWALDGLWRRLGLDELVRTALRGRGCDPVAVERVLFALVANRALEAGSKLAATRWVEKVAYVPGLASLDEDAAYRVMDLLLEVEDVLAEQVFWATATLLDLEVDLVFFDTSSTYFERDTADDPVARDDHGEPVPADGEGIGDPVVFRTYGHSKDSRDDLPQVVIGMAVTRTGIPIRTRCIAALMSPSSCEGPREPLPLRRGPRCPQNRIRPDQIADPGGPDGRSSRGQAPGRRPKLTPAREALLVDLYTTGSKSPADLAELFGVGRSTIERVGLRP